MVSFLAMIRFFRFIPIMTGRARRTAPLEAFLPTIALATMVLIVKILVIMSTITVVAPVGILLMKGLPVMRILLIPRIPLRLIPLIGPDNIGGRISVIRGPAILIAEELIEYSIQKPVTLVIDPRRP